jgi:hypothetical protein
MSTESIPLTPAKTSGLRSSWKHWLSSFWLILLFVPFMWKVKEWYPFSHFPMYSNLAEIWTLQMTDENNRTISTQGDFLGRPNSLRKLTTSRLRQVQKERNITLVKNVRLEDWAEAARRTMVWILERHQPQGVAAQAKAFRVWHLSFTSTAGEPTEERVLLYEHPNPYPIAPAP